MSNLGTPPSKINDKYEAIIIGAGIGGLVCGCYLAKNGLKVAIFEQHSRPGGYCTSYSRNGFVFDVAALQNCGISDRLGLIIKDLDIDEKVNIKRSDPVYILTSPDYKVTISADFDKTISNICTIFPSKKQQIEEFFLFLKNEGFTNLYLKRREKLGIYVDRYFNNISLKSLVYLIFGQLGVKPSEASILTAAMYFRNMIISGGYYATGGSWRLADAFANKFKEMGGHLFLSRKVEKIKINDGRVSGIILENKQSIASDFIVSACDVTQTYLDLVGKKYLNDKIISLLESLKPSISSFIVNMGITKNIKSKFAKCCKLWISPDINVDDPWAISRLNEKKFNGYIFCNIPSFYDADLAPDNCESITIGAYVLFLNLKYWIKEKEQMISKLTSGVSKVIPEVATDGIVKSIVTPITLQKYTLNRNGAMRGWAPFIPQIEKGLIQQKTDIGGLYLAGHWVTTAAGEAGLPMAAYTGKETCRLVLKAIRKKSILKGLL